MKRALTGLLLAGFLSACSDAPKPTFHAEGKPKLLSEWGQVAVSDDALLVARQAFPYELSTPLFSDYALKLRTVWLPDGTKAAYRDDDVFAFPVGTVITKTFYYPKGKSADEVMKVSGSVQGYLSRELDLDQYRLVETRILAHREEGWVAFPYVWNDEQSEAVLKRTGDIKRLTLVDGEVKADFAYVVPNQNQCAGCHATNNTTRAIEPIGPKARHLNRSVTWGGDSFTDQLLAWEQDGHLSGLPERSVVTYINESSPLEERARAYLDINCSHCHSDVGPADTSGLDLRPHVAHGQKLGFCKPPIAAGTGTGDRTYGIVPGEPHNSIFTFRMETTDPASMMPELGRSLAHKEGVKLIEDWIASLEGSCSRG